jgi:hypothetical protein
VTDDRINSLKSCHSGIASFFDENATERAKTETIQPRIAGMTRIL